MKVQPSFGEASSVTLAQRPHHVITAVAVPVSRFEPAPLDLGRKDRLECVEVAAAPGIESLLRNGQAQTVAHHASSLASPSKISLPDEIFVGSILVAHQCLAGGAMSSTRS